MTLHAAVLQNLNQSWSYQGFDTDHNELLMCYFYICEIFRYLQKLFLNILSSDTVSSFVSQVVLAAV